jgi:putative membrane protein
VSATLQDHAIPVAEWRRLDPRMLLIHPVIELGRSLPALIALLFAGHGSGQGSRWSLMGIGVVILAAMARWFTTRYRISADQIELRHGLVRRRTITASLDRVRTVDMTAHAMHRALGLAKVVIGTGTSDRKGQPALTLDGLAADEAASLRAELLHRTPRGVPLTHNGAVPAEAEDEIVRLVPRWVWFAPFTLSGTVAALAIAGFGWRIVNEAHVNPDSLAPVRVVLDQLRFGPLWRDSLEVGLGVLVFIAAASTIGYVLAFWNFRLTRHPGGTLHVSRGLITSRSTSVEERRLRGVEICEPLLLRAVGGARAVAIATGLRVGRGAERGGTVLIPPAPKAEAGRVAAAVLGTDAPVAIALVPHGPRARRRRFTRALTGSLLVGTSIALAWRVLDLGGWGWLGALVVVPLAMALAADRYRSLGHALVGGYLVTRFGSLVRRRSAISSAGIIGFNMRRSLFQRRAGLMTLTATTAAGRQSYRVQDVGTMAGVELADSAIPGLLSEFRVPEEGNG